MKIIFLIVLLASLSFAKKDWWETANFYQIYPRSFKDSNNDGIGDLRGIIEKLPYLKELGVTATWLSPILKSPQVDYGYDIADFYDVDPIFGTMSDLEEMFKTAHELGIKIIMDFVPNHTSDQHQWFIDSCKNDSKYHDYYVWHDGKPNPLGGRNLPPNNWQAVFKTRAWTFNEERQQYYLHQFASGQPDLNYRNPNVVQEMKNVLQFWMEKGADGFRIDAINHLFEVEDFRDEILTGWTDDPTDYGYTYHNYTKDLDETYDMVREWRILIDKYNEDHPNESTKVLFTEAYADIHQTMRYYGTKEEPIAHFPFNFLLIEKLDENKSALDFKREIDEWFANLPSGATSNWVLGNHDKPRFASRYGTERVEGMLMLLLLLPGVAVTYNGDELGMLDYRDGISWEETLDPQACNTNDPNNFKWASRDPVRTPFQWDNTTNSGFCESCKPWLPVNENYKTLNLAKQRSDEKSFFKFYQKLSKLRTDDIFANGDFASHAYGNDVFAFKRTYGDDAYIIIINFGINDQTVNANSMDAHYSRYAEVVAAGSHSNFKAGDSIALSGLKLAKYDAVVLKVKIFTEKEWWRTATFYQIYPRSFMDSTNDGIGDLQGMIDRLDHLKDAGFDTFWLSPIFKSPQKDTGYDVSDYYTIEPDYGTMNDFKTLIAKARSLGIRVMLDFIPNHTSDQHEWFIKSSNNDSEYRDYYVWHDGKVNSTGQRVPPNNWISVFGGPAWTWVDARQQYYLHQFYPEQPDLNYRNKNVVKAMSEMLIYYIDMGVSGFRLDAINHLFEDDQFRDEEPWQEGKIPENYDDLNHIHTKDLNETFLFVYSWRKMIDDYIAEKNLPSDILIMTEAYASTRDTMRYYRDSTNSSIRGAHMPFNFQLIFNFNTNAKAADVSRGIYEWLDNMPQGETANWVAGSHDHSRVASRIMPEKIHMVNTLVMTLPGASITYYGEEIGMHDNNDVPKWDSRNKNRTPMQWDGGVGAGFTKLNANETWLPIHPNYISVNLQAEIKRERGTYKYFQSLSALRKTSAIRKGGFVSEIVNEDVFAYSRNYNEEEEGYLIVINTSGSEQEINLSNFTVCNKNKLRVVTSAPNSHFKTGDIVDFDHIHLGLYDAVVFDYVSKKETTMDYVSTTTQAGSKMIANVFIFTSAIVISFLFN